MAGSIVPTQNATPNAKIQRTEPEVSEIREDYITIEFIEDGLTAWGRVWEKGKTATVRVNGDSWKETCGRDGKSYLELNVPDQIKRWGKAYFRRV